MAKMRLLALDLYDYLIALSLLLEGMGEENAASRVRHVSRFISGSTSELYGESWLLLPRVLQEIGDRFAEEDRARLQDVIAGIEEELPEARG